MFVVKSDLKFCSSAVMPLMIYRCFDMELLPQKFDAEFAIQATAYFVKACDYCQQCLSNANEILFHFRLGMKKSRGSFKLRLRLFYCLLGCLLMLH